MPRGVPRIPEPREWILTKKCAKCGEVKPWALFSPHGLNPDGSVRRVQSQCRKCKGEWMRSEAYRAWCERNRDELAKKKRARKERQRRAMLREKTNHTGMLPLEPFRSWLNGQIAELGIGEVAVIAGVPERSLYRVVTGESKMVSLSVVDRVLVRFGKHVDDFYPLEQAA